MSETKEVFSIEKPGAYKLRGGGIADILGVDDKSAFGWLRSDTIPMSMRLWDRTGVADAGCQDIIAAIPFVVDGPGRYMMRDGRVAMVDQMDRQNSVGGQRIGGWYKSHADSQKTDTSWHVNGAWHAIKGTDNDRDLIRKMHPLEQQPGAKAPEAPKVPETQAPLNNHVFRITEPGVYCTRNGRVVNIHEVTPTTANGHWKVSGHKREWLLNGRKHTYIDLGSDIVMKAPPADGVLKITDVVTRLRTDWDRRLAEREEQARKKSMGTKTPKTPPPVHLVVPGIEGKPTQQPSEEQLKLAYQDPPKPVTPKKPTQEFDLVMVQAMTSAPHIMVAGIYSAKDGNSTVLPVEGDLEQIRIACKLFPPQYNIMMLTNGDHFMCPTHSVAYVIHHGGHE